MGGASAYLAGGEVCWWRGGHGGRPAPVVGARSVSLGLWEGLGGSENVICALAVFGGLRSRRRIHNFGIPSSPELQHGNRSRRNFNGRERLNGKKRETTTEKDCFSEIFIEVGSSFSMRGRPLV